MGQIETSITRETVLALLRKDAQRLKTYGVRRLGLFGSTVRNQAGPKSDVDVLVEFEAGQKTFDNFIGLAIALEELLNRKIELVTPESLSPYIRPYILREIEYVTLVA